MTLTMTITPRNRVVSFSLIMYDDWLLEARIFLTAKQTSVEDKNKKVKKSRERTRHELESE